MMDPDVFASFQVKFTRRIGQRRVDDLHPQHFEEPAVADWRAALEASKVYGSRSKRDLGPRGQTEQG